MFKMIEDHYEKFKGLSFKEFMLFEVVFFSVILVSSITYNILYYSLRKYNLQGWFMFILAILTSMAITNKINFKKENK